MVTTTIPVMVIHTALLVLVSQSVSVHKRYQYSLRLREMIGQVETRRTVDEDGGGGQLGGQSDDPRVPIVPANNRMTLVRMGLML